MEITSKFRERETQQSPLNSPSSHGSSTTTSTCSTPTPIPITRSDPNSPYPTTFVTADTSSFKQVVQMLTGSSEPASPKPKPKPDPNPPPSKNFVIPPIKTTAPKKQGFKLYERRNSLKHHMISPLTPSFGVVTHQHASSFSPRNNNGFNNVQQEILSPSLLDFPALTLSPVTPLVEDPFNKSSPLINDGGGGRSSSSSEEERAIAQKGFYLHPSPRDNSEPRLLPLFPLSSPRMSGP